MTPEIPDLKDANSLQRRYDVDWLRTLAMALLIIYHVVISFQTWAKYIGFPHNDPSLEGLWIFMAIINIWRIPILFMISGMGIRFAMERRNLKQLLKDRTIRILVPYLSGIVILQYIVSIMLPHLGWDAEYMITFGHLWFLLNIYLYSVSLIGILIYLKDNPENILFRFLTQVIRWRFGLFLFALPIMIEAWLVNPLYFSTYVDTVHGWVLGLLCFFTGFIFISLKDVFWPAVKKVRWPALIVASALYLVRLLVYELQNEVDVLLAFESMCWMLAILGFGSLHLNKPSDLLKYCSRAVYPVYIVHLPVQFVLAYFILPGTLPAMVKLLLLLAGTFGVSLLMYEFIISRLKWIRPIFGIPLNSGPSRYRKSNAVDSKYRGSPDM